jgi:hypothetical protein
MRISLALLAVLAGCAIAAPSASAVTAQWWACGKDTSGKAAQAAGLPAAMDADPKLHDVFGDQKPSSILRLYRSYCADFDRDGDVDRAVSYACCTVSSPGPYAILRHDPTGWTTVYARLNDVVFGFAPRAGRLIVRSPKYGPNDANCCPGAISTRTLRYRHGRWAGTVSVRRAR